MSSSTLGPVELVSPISSLDSNTAEAATISPNNNTVETSIPNASVHHAHRTTATSTASPARSELKLKLKLKPCNVACSRAHSSIDPISPSARDAAFALLQLAADNTIPSTPTTDNAACTLLRMASGTATYSSPSPDKTGLKLKLRCIQSALHKPLPTAAIISRKRKSMQVVSYPEGDAESESEPFTSTPLVKKVIKKAKTHHIAAQSRDGNDETFEAGDESKGEDDPIITLVTPIMKRNERILVPTNPTHAALIAAATKVGSEYYDSDSSEVAGDVKNTKKPGLFRSVKWGPYAIDRSRDSEFVAEPEFTQFVPGRFELLPDGTLRDQKEKLIVKLLDKAGRKRIFANPPPRDWFSQEAITALNKRTVQQIRRNTNVRFREVVRAYVDEERRWILAHLTNGKPTSGWKAFVEEFNQTFEGQKVLGTAGTRPYRSYSSLTKEVERFGADFYTKGLVPVTAKRGGKKE